MASVSNVTANVYVGEPLNFSYPAVTWGYTGTEDKRAGVSDGVVVNDPNYQDWPNGIDGVYNDTSVVVTFDAYSGDNPPGPTGLSTSVLAYIPDSINGGVLTRNDAAVLSGKKIAIYAQEDPHSDGFPRSGFLTFNVEYPPAPTVDSASVLGVVGTAISYQAKATFNPYNYSANVLPAGLSLDPLHGLITGVPTAAATTYTTLVAENYGGDGTGHITFLIQSNLLGSGGGGAYGLLEVFDLNPSRTKRMAAMSVQGGDGGAGAGGVSSQFTYQKNVPCLTPVYSALTVTQPTPVGMEISFSDYYTDDVRISINGTAIQDWQRCGNQVGNVAYVGPIEPGDVVKVDFFAQCAVSGKTSDWTATVGYLSGGSIYYDTYNMPPLTDNYFQNTGYSTLSPMWHAHGQFTIKSSTDAAAWSGAAGGLLTILQTATGNFIVNDEDVKAVASGVSTLHHFRPDYDYESMSLSRSPLNYKMLLQQEETYTDALQMATGLKTFEHAWLSYDVTSGGFPTQVLQGYAIALIDSLTGNSIKYNDGGSELLGNDPQFTSGFCQQVGAIVDNTGSGCQDPDDLPDSLKYCLTGSGQQEIQDARSGILEIMKSFGQDVKITLPDIEDFDSSQVTGSYYQYTGAIAYNQPESGDSICFTQYVFADGKDYSGEYSGTFGHVPPYPSVDFCLNYPKDYHDIYSLAAALNTRLSGNHQVWYEFPCTFNQYDGYYENTGIMEFTVADSNTITFKSILVGQAGKHDWQFNYTGHHEITEISYLLPSTILMQGSFDNESWTTLQSCYDIDWTQITPTTGTTTFQHFLSGGHTSDPDQQTQKSGVGVAGVIAVQLGTLTGSGTTKCGTNFTTTFDLEVPIDPTGCPEPEDDDKDDKDNDPDPNAQGQNPNDPGIVSYTQLKTGWKFENDTPYNYYRIFLDEFSVAPDGDVDYVSGFFAIQNINLFGTASGDKFLTSDVCLIDADYTVKIESQTTGFLTGMLTGYADAKTSGAVVWDRTLVTGVPNGDGHVKFQVESGYATEPFQALVSASVTGHGMVFDQTGGFYIYDSGDHVLLPPPIISGEVTGCGMITGGPYLIVGNSGTQTPYFTGSADLERIVGSLYEYVVQSYTFPVTGYIPDVPVPGYNIPAFGYLDGTLTNIVTPQNSGYYQFNTGMYGVPSIVYSNVVSGYENFAGTISFPDPSAISGGDRIVINGRPLIYSTGDKIGPTYYSGIDSFVNLINSDSSGYGVVASLNHSHIAPTLISLDASVSGDAGNIGVSWQGINPPTYQLDQSGVTYYQTLDNAVSVFQGNINQSVAAVSYFQNAPTNGIVSGYLNYISQIRNFSDVWSLRTGLDSYLASGWLTSGYIYERPNSLPTVIFNSPGSLNMTVGYNSSAAVTTPDVVTLRISGVNFPEYIEFNITGHV